MKRLSIILFATLSLSATSQTYIKANALYWAALLPNVQVETRMGNQFTFQDEVNASLWGDVLDGFASDCGGGGGILNKHSMVFAWGPMPHSTPIR